MVISYVNNCCSSKFLWSNNYLHVLQRKDVCNINFDPKNVLSRLHVFLFWKEILCTFKWDGLTRAYGINGVMSKVNFKLKPYSSNFHFMRWISFTWPYVVEVFFVRKQDFFVFNWIFNDLITVLSVRNMVSHLITA